MLGNLGMMAECGHHERGEAVMTRLAGIDFSGAQDAGRRIWITTGRLDGKTLIVEGCQQAQELPGAGRDRERAFTAVVAFIAAGKLRAVGCDFPFSLPGRLIDPRDWPAFVATFARAFASPEAFRRHYQNVAEGRELKRLCDRQARTPFSPYNLRMYRQTYHGLRDLLAPLVVSGRAVALPMQPARDDVPWLLEICPASLLKHCELYQPYKGPSPDHRRARSRILRAITGAVRLDLSSRRIRRRILDDPGGDALDSLLGAISTARTVLSHAMQPEPWDDAYAIEGFVYI